MSSPPVRLRRRRRSLNGDFPASAVGSPERALDGNRQCASMTAAFDPIAKTRPLWSSLASRRSGGVERGLDEQGRGGGGEADRVDGHDVGDGSAQAPVFGDVAEEDRLGCLQL